MRPILIAALALLLGCTPRAQLVPAPDTDRIGTVYPVYVATTREVGGGRPTSGRSEAMSFLRLDVSVPPDRARGSIKTPIGTADPRTEFVLTRTEALRDAARFRRALGRALAEKPPEAREIVLYVHGYNTRFDEGVLRLAQIGHDFRTPGVEVHYAWPSAGNPLGYAYDSESALIARDGLEDLLGIVRQSGARDVIIVAHSLGGLVVMEAFRQMEIARPGSVAQSVNGVFLLSPDIDVDVFLAQTRRIRRLPEEFIILVSEKDRALRLSARLTGQSERLGNLPDPSRVAHLDVTLLDVTAFSEGTGHSTVATSPGLIALLSEAREVSQALGEEPGNRPDILTGTVLTIQNATEVILSPTSAVRR